MQNNKKKTRRVTSREGVRVRGVDRVRDRVVCYLFLETPPPKKKKEKKSGKIS